MPQGIGYPLLGQQPTVNPFTTALSAAPTALPGTASTPTAGEPVDIQGRKNGWQQFVQRFKSDPDLRLALFQTALSLTQPAESGQEAVGRALSAGLGTLQSLEQQRFERGRVGRAEGREDRRLTETERRGDIAEQGLAQDQSQFEAAQGLSREQFADRQSLARDELSARLENIQNDAQYQRDLLALRREELDQGQGVTNQQWSRLTDVLLRVNRDQFSEDPEQAQAEATARAWNLLRGSQERSTLKTRLMSEQLLFITDSDGNVDPEALKRLSEQVDRLLDAAGVTDSTISGFLGQGGGAPVGGPSGTITIADAGGAPQPTPAPQGSPVPGAGAGGEFLQLQPGTDVDIQGRTFRILTVEPNRVLVRAPNGEDRYLNREMVENFLRQGAGGGPPAAGPQQFTPSTQPGPTVRGIIER